MGEIKMSKKETEIELGLSVRKIRRLVRRIKAEGISGICHGNLGKVSGRKNYQMEYLDMIHFEGYLRGYNQKHFKVVL